MGSPRPAEIVVAIREQLGKNLSWTGPLMGSPRPAEIVVAIREQLGKNLSWTGPLMGSPRPAEIAVTFTCQTIGNKVEIQDIMKLQHAMVSKRRAHCKRVTRTEKVTWARLIIKS